MIDIGSLVNGRYKVLASIGSGGMANVFLAHDLILDRDVAMKVLRFNFQNDQTAIRRFQREALAATELVHPNIVSVYDVDEENGMQYLIMEFVQGMDLKRYIQTHNPIPYEKIVDIMQQILSAVKMAHEHGIIHRDLKPQNILIDDAGVAKITDFGIAIALSETSLTQTNSLLGSVHYLSPEQARGSMATKQSDIYALGIILYELITGQVPFDGESAVTIALKHFQEEMPSIKDLDPQIPQSLENIVLKATTKDPADRYKTVDEMSDDLSLALTHTNVAPWTPSAMLMETQDLTPVNEPMPTTAPEETPIPAAEENNKQKKPKKKKKKRKKLWLLIILLLILGTVGLAYAFYGGSAATVPNVRNMTETAARTAIEAEDLVVATETQSVASNAVDEGRVVRTNPASGKSVESGSTITLYISSGNKQITLKNYRGETLEDAQNDLQKKGFLLKNIKVKRVNSASVPEGEIVRQTPKAGEKVDPKNDTITFRVSKGPKTITIGDYTNMSYDNARAALLKLGLSDSQINRSEESSESVSEGAVIRQSLVSGSELSSSDSITLTVSTGSSSVTVPSGLVGATEASAKSKLEAVGLSAETTEESSSSVAEGNVIRISPSSGSSVAAGSSVTLVISSGTGNVTVPDGLIGVNQATATAQLSAAGLTAKITETPSNNVTAGNVISVSPGSGSSVKSGSSVSVVVSSGPASDSSSGSSSSSNDSSSSSAS